MSIQSPKSQRPHGSSETPAGNDISHGINTSPIIGTQGPDNGRGSQPVPKNMGKVHADSTPVPVHSSAPHQGGGPSAAGEGDQNRKGGNKHVV